MDDRRKQQILAQRAALKAQAKKAARAGRLLHAFGLDGDCANCGGPLPPQLHAGNPRRWCSEACRLQAYRARTTTAADRA